MVDKIKACIFISGTPVLSPGPVTFISNSGFFPNIFFITKQTLHHN